mmetsp:Transcript_6335/g.15383  ORF Transcript_6335/g.15383 Transcript_6335/m.15383 type:complete len:224 (-) Transcript_6335:487-1158(-)
MKAVGNLSQLGVVFFKALGRRHHRERVQFVAGRSRSYYRNVAEGRPAGSPVHNVFKLVATLGLDSPQEGGDSPAPLGGNRFAQQRLGGLFGCTQGSLQGKASQTRRNNDRHVRVAGLGDSLLVEPAGRPVGRVGKGYHLFLGGLHGVVKRLNLALRLGQFEKGVGDPLSGHHKGILGCSTPLVVAPGKVRVQTGCLDLLLGDCCQQVAGDPKQIPRQGNPRGR